MGIFILPDLGEGLPDATIRKWYVNVGDAVKTDQPLVAVETAKAVVDIPAAFTGKITVLKGNPGDVINVGDTIIEFEEEAGTQAPKVETESAQSHETNADKPKAAKEDASAKTETPEKKPAPQPATAATQPAEVKPKTEEPSTTDAKPTISESNSATTAKTVVGNLKTEAKTVQENATGVQPQQTATTNTIKAVPAARLIAREFNIDLSTVTPSGKDNVITIDDVKKVLAIKKAPSASAAPSTSNTLTPLTQAQRGLAQIMAKSHEQITPATLIENADLHTWSSGEDITVRLIQAIVAGLKTEPMLNTFYYHDQAAYQLNSKINIGVAVDTDKGLYMPVIKDAAALSPEQLREQINQFKQKSAEHTFSPDDLDGANIMLSNYGSIIGQYATPTLVPPMVAIVGAGKIYRKVVPIDDQKMEIHRTLPLSITIDHRLITGGQVARFLQTLIQTLEKVNDK